MQPRFGQASTLRPVCIPKAWSNGQTCDDPLNLDGNDDCYFALASYGDPTAEKLARAILAGTANASDAEQFLEANFSASQQFIQNELGKTIHPNFTAGHSQTKAMSGAIVHYTAYPTENLTIGYFVGAQPHASTHFIIGIYRNGLPVQLFHHKNRTWHAGSSFNVDRFGIDFANAGYLKKSGGDWVDYADRSYHLWLPLHGDQAIEVTGGIPGAASKYANSTHWQPYTYYQLLSYVLLTRALRLTYGTVKSERIQRHGDVAASRVDPGPHLPLTFLQKLTFNGADVFTTAWLNAYKSEANWIQAHPEAR